MKRVYTHRRVPSLCTPPPPTQVMVVKPIHVQRLARKKLKWEKKKTYNVQGGRRRPFFLSAHMSNYTTGCRRPSCKVRTRPAGVCGLVLCTRPARLPGKPQREIITIINRVDTADEVGVKMVFPCAIIIIIIILSDCYYFVHRVARDYRIQTIIIEFSLNVILTLYRCYYTIF